MAAIPTTIDTTTRVAQGGSPTSFIRVNRDNPPGAPRAQRRHWSATAEAADMSTTQRNLSFDGTESSGARRALNFDDE